MTTPSNPIDLNRASTLNTSYLETTIDNENEINSSKIDLDQNLFALQENDFPTSIAREVNIITHKKLDGTQELEKLSLIANKILSLEAQQKGKGKILIDKLEEVLIKDNLPENDDSIKAQIKLTQKACSLLRDIINQTSTTHNETSDAEASPNWGPQLKQLALAHRVRTLESARITLEELQHLKNLIGLSIPEDSLRDLEALSKELNPLEGQQSSDLNSDLKLLQSVHTQRHKLKQVAATIQSALQSWEATRRTGRRIDINADAELYREFGYKHGRLIEQSEFLKEAQVPGVEVPIPHGISNSHLHNFLDQHFPELNAQWEILNKGFLEFQNKKPPGKSDSAYLQQPEVKEALKKIESSILQAFEKEENFNLPMGMEEWMAGLKKKGLFMMVRSSGTEDTRFASNAGGNLSESYVDPEKGALCSALGLVVKSFYGEASLQNRLNSGQNPFAEPQHLAVSVQELIGESVNNQDPGNIPISLVLFSNEPTYVGKEPFRIMRISATYGHGEGVVGAAGVRSDTYTLMRSVKHPERLYILEDVSAKPQRLAPVRNPETGKVKLEKVDNPPELIHKEALDKRLLAHLFYLGVTVERVYDWPMDMELVIKDGTIYPVQARPINRPDADPTFLDWKKVNQAENESHKGPWERFSAEPFLPGTAQAAIMHKPEQLLICDSLENAEKLFKKGQHCLVVIKQEEPANSHPVVNFSGMGIPVMYSENQEQLEQLSKGLDGSKSLIACVQTGHFLLWEGDHPENCISRGYTAHPARVVISTDSQLRPKVRETAELPQEIKSLLSQVRALESQEAALSALRELKERLNEAIGTKKTRLAEMLKKDPDLPRAKELMEGIESWEKVSAEAHSVFKKTIKSSPEGSRLKPLFHAKIVESLTTQKVAPQALGRLSLLNIDDQLKAVGKIANFRSKFENPSQMFFSEEILLGEMSMTAEQEMQWEQFLTALENKYQQIESLQNVEEAKMIYNRFKEMLLQMQQFDLLPIWMARFFLPVVTSKNLIDSPEEAYKMMCSFCEQFPTDLSYLQLMEVRNQEMTRLSENLNRFASAGQFQSAFTELKEVAKPFIAYACDTWPEGKDLWSQIENNRSREANIKRMQENLSRYRENRKILNVLNSERNLEKIVSFQMMGKLVELFDSAIKSMKASPNFSDEEKSPLFHQMLESYYTLLGVWIKNLYIWIHQHIDWPMDKYLSKMSDILDNVDMSPQSLLPSSSFDVSAAFLGPKTDFGRSLPKTMEDFFTLTHQNLLVILQVLLFKEMTGVVLPQSLSDEVDKIKRLLPSHNVNCIGYTFTSEGIKLHYNYTLANHSAFFTLEHDKKTQDCLINVSFAGDPAKDRWKIIASLFQCYHDAAEMQLNEAPKVKQKQVNFTVNLSKSQDSSKVYNLLKCAADYTIAGEEIYVIINKIESDDILNKITKNGIINREHLLNYLSLVPVNFKSLSEELKQDGAFCLEALRGNTTIWQYIPIEFTQDRDFYLEALRYNVKIWTVHPRKNQEEDEELCIAACSQDGNILKRMSPECTKNEAIVRAAVKQNPNAIIYAYPEVRNILIQENPSFQNILDRFFPVK